MKTNLCKCGCGQQTRTKYGKSNGYVNGHNSKGIRKKIWPTYTCAHCGKSFEDLPSRGKRTYCGNECRDEYRRIHTGSENPIYKERVPAKCFVCGKDMMVLPSRISRTNRISCSSSCGHKIRIEVIKQIKRKGYGKKAALLRDGGKCVICGFSHIVTVHHITPRKVGGGSKLTNLVSLCPNHHYMVHAGLIDSSDLKKFAVDFHCSSNDRKTLKQRPVVDFKKQIL
jgi:5-methylcytosine-specific restriction endonuclease McrA